MEIMALIGMLAVETLQHLKVLKVILMPIIIYDLWRLLARRLQLIPRRDWQDTLDQKISLALPEPQRNLTFLAWQSSLYWLWSERNGHLHANTFWSVEQIFRLLDRQRTRFRVSEKLIRPDLRP
ncbi:unnamed protein product [Eruca vesicaria subsp. sativa]|uniref:Uncharacterized protein n=1 Tax=Eruca vesicaria subsp. sativa TaxID=29727 RepID=A0ABC8KN23_ERUVS|nr:unnamed protein product [Eruca vesicaria subsp. sativa]